MTPTPSPVVRLLRLLIVDDGPQMSAVLAARDELQAARAADIEAARAAHVDPDPLLWLALTVADRVLDDDMTAAGTVLEPLNTLLEERRDRRT